MGKERRAEVRRGSGRDWKSEKEATRKGVQKEKSQRRSRRAKT